MVKLASSPYGIWLYSYINHSNSEARQIKRVRGQRLRLDLAERNCRLVLASCSMAPDAKMDRALLAPRWATRPISTCVNCARTRAVASTVTRVIRMPEHYGELSPLLHVVPLQLLAYHTACVRGTDVDKPRNLAKSVTVE